MITRVRIPALVDMSFASYYNVLNIYRGNEERNINGTKIQLSFFCLGWKAQAGNEPTRVQIINKEQRSSAINIVNSPFLHNIATSLAVATSPIRLL